MTSRPSTATPILAVLAVVLVMLAGMYVGGYFWLGKHHHGRIFGTKPIKEYATLRSYPYQWAKYVFYPAASVETWLRGEDVYALWDGEP